MTVTIGSLFSGIGGLELGLERAGHGPVVWQAESDPFCRKVLAKHWPNATRYEDVRSIDGKAKRVDIICGGFPCQDISVAGKQAGIDGERSGLWREYARIVRELRPRIVVVENVSALLIRGMERVLGDLAACGYDAHWDCIPAAAIGAPHRRDRIFVVARRVSDTERNPVRIITERREDPPQAPDRRNPFATQLGDKMADSYGDGRENERVGKVLDVQRETRRDHTVRRNDQGWPPQPDDMQAWGRVQADSQPAVCRVANGIPDRVDRLRSLGNAVVPQVAELIGRTFA